MPNYPYDELDTKIDRSFVQGLNKNFDEVERDMREVTEPLKAVLDGEFDNAALATEFETRANEKLEEIQPEFYQFKTDTAAQLEQTATKSELQKVSLSYKETYAQKAIQTRRLKSDRLKDNLPSNLRIYSLPDGFSYKEIPINIYNDGNMISTDYSKDNFKHLGGKTYHVTVSGAFGNDGLTETTATNFRQALNYCVKGDTISIHSGLYNWEHFDFQTELQIAKEINIIADDDVIIVAGNMPAFTKTTGYNSIYQMTSSACLKIVDVNFGSDGYSFKKVSNLEDCESSVGSYYISGSTVYVNPLQPGNPTGKLANLMKDISWFWITNPNASANFKVFLEKLTLFGGSSQSLRADVGTTVIADNVTGAHTVGAGASFRNTGGSTIYYKCRSIFNERDGFSYQQGTARGIEIDCVGAHNGLSNASTIADGAVNGSTAHDGGKVVSVNGDYYGNMGGNVADVHSGTQRVCIGTRAFDSAVKSEDYKDTDFTTQQPGAEMWLINCDSWGSKFNIQAVADTTIHIENTTYDLLGGLGNILKS